MKIKYAIAALLMLMSHEVMAQGNTTGLVVASCGNQTFKAGNPGPFTVDLTGKVCVNLGSGAGTVTSVSVTTANGVSGVVANPTTTPAITLTLGAITPSSISTGGQITSTLAIGTAPLVITSTTLVPNLYVARAVLADSATTNANLTGDVTSIGNATTLVTAQPGAHTWAAAQTINLNSASALSPVTGTALQVAGANGTIGRVQATSFGAIASFTAARANGTGASPTAVVSGDQIGGVNAYSYVTSASPGFVGPVASYQTFATENHTTTAMGSKAVIATTPNGSTTLTTALTVDQDQSATLVGRLTAAGITNTGNGAASVAAQLFSGTVFTGGSGTTNLCQVLMQPTGTTAVTTWSPSGGGWCANMPSGFAGNFLDFHAGGATSVFKLTSAGYGMFGDGAVGTPSISFLGATTTGFYRNSTAVRVTSSGNDVTEYGFSVIPYIAIPITGAFQWATLGTSVQAQITSSGTGVIKFGAADAAVAVAQTTRVQSVVAGTAAANGANWTLIGSLPTGTGTSGDIIVQTGVKTGSGTTQGTPTTALTIKGETQALVTAALDASTSAGGALQVVGGASVAKRFWIPAITASSGLQTAVLCQSSGGEMIADSVACLASSARFKDIRGPLSSDIVDKFMKLPIKVWAYKEEGIFKRGNWTRDRIGPIAEDVEKLDPRLVEYDKDGQVRAYSTEQLLAYTIKVVQEQQIQIDGLRARRR